MIPLIGYMTLVLGILISLYIYQQKKLKTIGNIQLESLPPGLQFDSAELSKNLIKEWEKNGKRSI